MTLVGRLTVVTFTVTIPIDTPENVEINGSKHIKTTKAEFSADGLELEQRFKAQEVLDYVGDYRN